jgi:hypothetical protein
MHHAFPGEARRNFGVTLTIRAQFGGRIEHVQQLSSAS